MEELKNLTTMQLVNMIQELSASNEVNFSDGTTATELPMRSRFRDINEVADVLMNKLKVQAFKSVMGAE